NNTPWQRPQVGDCPRLSGGTRFIAAHWGHGTSKGSLLIGISMGMPPACQTSPSSVPRRVGYPAQHGPPPATGDGPHAHMVKRDQLVSTSSSTSVPSGASRYHSPQSSVTSCPLATWAAVSRV